MKLTELQQALHKITPAAVLVSPQVLDRVIQQVLNLPALPWDVPHRKSYVVDRQDLFRHIEQEDLNLSPEHILPSTVILLLRPAGDWLASASRDIVLGQYWRRLFHASVHLLLEQRWKDGALALEEVRRRIDAIGQAPFQEARKVLVEERYLQERAAEQAYYIEFAAVFLELRYFAANLLPIYFPSLRDPAMVERIVGQDFDVAALFNQTRLEGAPNPVPATDTSSDESNDFYWRLIRSAERAADANNTVRAAVLRTRAARVAPANLTRSTRALAEADMSHLANRLQTALKLEEKEAQEWPAYLKNLLDKADQGNRPVEADLLFELQKVCLDSEQGIYALSLVDWMLSLGRRPIKRPLPAQVQVRLIKHLRSAGKLLSQARVSDSDRQELGRLIQSAVHQSEERLRVRFRPILEVALEDVGLLPANPPERTAFYNIIEEVLDRIIAAGYLTFSDLRDVISRNQLKLPDLGEPQDLLRGDPLLRLDRRLSALLDGVYRPSEVYSRLLEQLTALNFGTPAGRLLTTYVTLPFGGAFLILEVFKILADWIAGPDWLPRVRAAQTAALASAVQGAPVAGPDVLTSSGLLPSLVGWLLFGALGCYLLALWHSQAVRTSSARGFRIALEGMHVVLVDWPRRLTRLAYLRRLVASWPFLFFYWYLFKPILVFLLLGLLQPDFFFGSWPLAIVAFILVVALINSNIGQVAGDVIGQGLVWLYELITAGLFKGLFSLVASLFKEIVSSVEGVLFTVDEWLRFRTGEGKFWMGVRLLLGALWFPISYVLRFYIVVLIEPGFNPLKFPLSSVAAKFVYPATFPLFQYLEPPATTHFLIYYAVRAFLWTTYFFLPDAFAYIFWELKENWGLYKANRSPVLRPLAIGHHGETMLTLLQPGFHSGTIPRLFARWRRAEREAVKTGSWKTARYYRLALEELEQTLNLFVMRNLVSLVHQSQAWSAKPLGVGQVQLGCGQVRLELVHTGYRDRPVWINFEEQQGWLLANIDVPGWLPDLPANQVQPLNTALVGLYKLADVGLVREQIQAQLPPTVHAYEVTSRELIVWLDHRHGQAVSYSWFDVDGKLKPLLQGNNVVSSAAELDATRFIFARVPLYWQQFVECWERDQQGLGHPRLVSGGVDLDLIDLVRAKPGEKLPPKAQPPPSVMDRADPLGGEASHLTVNGAIDSPSEIKDLPGPNPS